jgi:hypothetical protein
LLAYNEVRKLFLGKKEIFMLSESLNSACRLMTKLIRSGTQMMGALDMRQKRGFVILLCISTISMLSNIAVTNGQTNNSGSKDNSIPGVSSAVSTQTGMAAQGVNAGTQTYVWKDGNAKLKIPSTWSIKEQIKEGNPMLEASGPDNNPPDSIMQLFIFHKASLGTTPSIWDIKKANLNLEVLGYEGSSNNHPGEYGVTEITGAARLNGVKVAAYEYLYENYIKQEAWLAIAISRSEGSQDDLDILLSDPEINNIARGIIPLE